VEMGTAVGMRVMNCKWGEKRWPDNGPLRRAAIKMYTFGGVIVTGAYFVGVRTGFVAAVSEKLSTYLCDFASANKN
jgi:hypothetical protein